MIRQDDKNIVQLNGYQYFGSVELYSTLIFSKNMFFLPEMGYQKYHHSNRMWISGANGLIGLSIPLHGGRNQKGYLKDVQIAEDGNWRRIHWRSIHDSYRKSPWFEELGWQIEDIYQKPEKFLLDWNIRSMKLISKFLKMNLDILTASEHSMDHTGELLMNLNPFSKLPVSYPVYQQVFMERSGFIANLSILDLLFCCGPGSVSYLEKLAIHKSMGQISS
ncbi:MAG TPA: WbqC family protein [Lacibacter sp.]|nr:WbqC family protein [Lacibacter sp.]